jgi:hypothetical protein
MRVGRKYEGNRLIGFSFVWMGEIARFSRVRRKDYGGFQIVIYLIKN